MQKLIKFPLIFFFIASLIGLALRYHYFQPIPEFNFPYWLHAHSHIMFLGWVFNALSIGFVIAFIPTTLHKKYVILFYIINILVLCMLLTFPIQGYGIYSIVVSTLHTAVVAIFCLWFFKDTRVNRMNIAVSFARISLMFFLISAIGPFVVGALVANGLAQSDWYHLAVYYYLHFQYNGVFTFGIFALLFNLYKEKGINFELKDANRFRILLLSSCFPAYLLSTLWTTPPVFVNLIGLFAALVQLLALYYFLRSWRGSWSTIKLTTTKPTQTLLMIALFAFATKLFLQLLSVYPPIAMLAYEIRFYVIAYLHLVLVGMVSLFLMAWYSEQYIIPLKRIYVFLLLVGFVSSELVMISVGQWPDNFNVSKWMVITSTVMVIGITGITNGFLHNLKREKRTDCIG